MSSCGGRWRRSWAENGLRPNAGASCSLPCPDWVTNAFTTLDVTAVMVAVASFLTSAELFALRAEFQAHGLFDPLVTGSTRRGLMGRQPRIASIPLVSGLQLPLAAAVVVCVAVDVSPTVPLVALAATTMVRTPRLPYGLDGSDSMSLLLTVTIAIA